MALRINIISRIAFLLLAFAVRLPALAEDQGMPEFKMRTLGIQGFAVPKFITVRLGDINSDGRADLYAASLDNTSLWVGFSHEDYFAKALQFSGLDPSCLWETARVLDLDFDGRNEVLANRHRGKPGEHDICVAKFDGSRFASYVLQAGQSAGIAPITVSQEVFGDFENDGTLDYFFQATYGILMQMTINPQQRQLQYSSHRLAGQVMVLGIGDTDGDKKQELVGMTGVMGNLFVWCSDLNFPQSCHPLFEFPRGKKPGPIFFGDYNGDGSGDLFLPGNETNGSWLGLSQKTAGIEYEMRSLGLLSQLELWKLLIGDIDGDGADEIAFVNENKAAVTVWDLTFQSVSPRQGEALDLNGFREGPAVCIGYLPDRRNPLFPGQYSKWQMIPEGSCPEDYAFFGTGLPKDTAPFFARFRKTDKSGSPLSGSCCKLPSADILSNDHLVAANTCPEDTIATGVSRLKCKDCGFGLRCTKINRQRYQLGEKTAGVYWGADIEMLEQEPRILRSSIPAAIREGIGRNGFNRWEADGCIGRPWGSVLVTKAVNRCAALQFRELQYKGLPGDPPSGTAVKMFPECDNVEDIYNPLTGCAR